MPVNPGSPFFSPGHPSDEKGSQHHLLFLQNSSLFEGYGGIEYYQDDFLTLASECYSGAHVCAVIPKRSQRFALKARPYGTRVVTYSNNRWVQKWQNRFSRLYLKKAREAAKELKPTLIIVGHISLAPVAYLLSKAIRVPFVVLGYGIEIWGDLWPQDDWALKHAAGIFSISHWTRRILLERGFSPESIQVIQPHLPTACENLPETARERKAGTPLTLLTVSRLDASEQYKGQDHVLEALHRLRKTDPAIAFKYIIQGDGDDLPRLKALTEEMEIEDIVDFRPGVKDRSELENVYREADLFVMPSRFGKWEGRWRGEGFGIVYLEAGAHSLPLVAYDCGGATDIIRHGQNGMLVDPDNIAELARTLLHLHREPKLLLSLGRQARETVMKTFTREQIRVQLKEALALYLP